MNKSVDIQEFARRVEGLCDFLLSKIEIKDGSDDVRLIQDIKEDAADLQHSELESGYAAITGLHNFMKGLPNE